MRMTCAHQFRPTLLYLIQKELVYVKLFMALTPGIATAEVTQTHTFILVLC